jgi:hypothetical protein
MADSSSRLRIEEWLVRHALPELYAQPFHKGPLPLAWPNGKFEVDGISADRTIAVCISTATCRTATNRAASGKYNKIRSDALFLLNVAAPKKVLAFTDMAMCEHFRGEQESGRFPPAYVIAIIHVQVPPHLQGDLAQAAAEASMEVTPVQTVVPADE